MKTTSEYREQFESLVEKAEDEIRNNPDAYKKKLKYLAILGYLLIFLLVFLLVSIVAGTTWAALSSTAFLLLLFKKKLIFVVVGVIWVLVKSLFVKIEEPEGMDIEREYYPEIWREIDDLQKTLKTPTIDRLVLVPEMNAAIAQTPRFGMIGPYKNTLILGLELLISLSPQQAKAVLAHEFAHLSGNHGKFGAWIYRVRMTWLRIQMALEQSLSWGTAPISKIIQWYVPYFNGYSFVLARQNEYEADAVAAELTSNHAASSALVATHVYGDISAEHFWRPLYDQAYRQAEPIDDVYNKFEGFMQNTFSRENVIKRSVANALKEETDSADTHPALIDRLKALKSPGKLEQVGQSAARKWFGNKYEQLVSLFNKEWIMQNQEAWKEFNQRAEEARKEIKYMQSLSSEVLGKEDKLKLAQLIELYQPEVDSLPYYQQYLSIYPDDVEAKFALGRLLVKKEDPEGIPYLEASSQVESYKQAAAEQLWQYYLKKGDKALANHWLYEAEAAYDTFLKATEERQTPGSAKQCIPTHLSATDDKLISRILGQTVLNKKVSEIWLAEKQLEYFKDSPVYLLGFVTKGFSLSHEALLEDLAENLGGTESDTIFLVTKNSNKKLFKRIKEVGIQVY